MAKSFTPSIKRVETDKLVETSIKRAKKLLSEKSYDEALLEFEAIVRKDQANAFVHSAIGRIKFKQREFDTALHHFQVAIQIDPANALQAYLRCARIHFMQDDVEKARLALESALQINSKSSIAYAGLGLVQWRVKNAEEAIEFWKKALAYNPRMMAVRKRIATAFYEIGSHAEAIAQINAALRIDAEDPDAYAIKGRFHLLDKEYKDAQKAYEDAVALDPEGKKPSIRFGLIEAYIQLNKFDQAETILKEVSPRQEFSSFIHKLWGDLYTAKGMHKEALEEYRGASLMAGEGLGIEELDALDLFGDDGGDEKWESLASTARNAAARVLEARRHAERPRKL